MKKNIFSIFTIGAVLLFSGCTDKLENEFVPKNSGDEIVFGARATYELNEDRNKAPETRTVYTGEFLDSNGETWENGDGAKYEGVKWIAGDQVRIFCPDAAGRKTADYTVTLSGTQQEHVASLIRNANYDGALQWGDTNSTHHFYAVYPAPSQYTDGPVAGNVLNNNTELKGTIPAVQPHLGKDYSTTEKIAISVPEHDGLDAISIAANASNAGTNYIVAPNMEYAYMVARRDVIPNETEDAVYLNFIPVATAVEITIQNLARNADFPTGESLFLTNVLVSSPTINNVATPICGEFEVDLAAINEDGTSNIKAEPFIPGLSVGEQISIPMYQNGIYGDPIELKFGDAITFTVFMLPTAEVNNLNIVVQALGGTKSGNLTGIEITKRKKSYIKNLPFVGKNLLPFTQSEWLRFVDDAVTLKNLSIPGAGGAASGEKTTSGAYAITNDYSRQQNLSIEELWNKGVRCFEFATDVHTGSTTIADNDVLCNGEPCAVDLGDAVKLVRDQLVKHPKEFAMIILTYQTLGGWSSRDPVSYMSQINTFWGTVSNALKAEAEAAGVKCQTALYNPGDELGDVRGSLYCIARPVSIYQDYAPAGESIVVPNGTNFWGTVEKVAPEERTLDEVAYKPANLRSDILIIEGWGALKDKWQQRGYTHQSVRTTTAGNDGKPGRNFDVATWRRVSYESISDFEYQGYYWTGAKPADDYVPGTLNYDFTYNTNLAGENAKAWVQEWARVSDNTARTIYLPDGIPSRLGTTRAIYWGPTIEEKEGHVKDALQAAVGKTKPGCSIYINSLCGYFVRENIAQSWTPLILTDYNVANSNKAITSASQKAGLEGDIQSFANHINQYFYNLLQLEANKYEPGSMGITLMDRVEKTGVGASIPGIIVANNFQHDAAATTGYTLRKSNYEEGDKLAAPAQRGVKSTDEGVSIVWE